MSRDAVPINIAARQLGKSASTVRRWIQRGCPCVKPGEVGRGKGSILNLADVLAWRAGGIAPADQDNRLEFVADVLMDSFKRDEITIKIGITTRELAGVLALIYQRYYRNLTHEQPDMDKLPDEITQLLAIYIK